MTSEDVERVKKNTSHIYSTSPKTKFSFQPEDLKLTVPFLYSTLLKQIKMQITGSDLWALAQSIIKKHPILVYIKY